MLARHPGTKALVVWELVALLGSINQYIYLIAPLCLLDQLASMLTLSKVLPFRTYVL